MTVTGPAVGAASPGGLTFVPSEGGVVTLNYYDGRFLRADDLNLERRSQREYTELSNRAAGPGPVHGFDVSGLGSGELRLSAGLAISPRGRVLHLPEQVRARVSELLGTSAPATVPQTRAGFTVCEPASGGGASSPVPGVALFLVRLSPASRAQGDAEVVGRLCDGCVTATDRPYLVDGVTVELRPIGPDLGPWSVAGLTRPDLHLRSQVASAYYEAERRGSGPGMSAALLASAVWGSGAGSLAGDDGVAVGVLGWDGSAIVLLDPWTARRESVEVPPATYWGGRLEQRSQAVFTAQVLQFQDQLAAAPPAPGGSVQQLLDRGFVELPPAGYLPLPGGTADLRATMANQFGPGVELRLCAVRRDQIPGELDDARHLERISLLGGMRDAAAREQVDVLVPDGRLDAPPDGLSFAVDLAFGREPETSLAEPAQPPRGTARGIGAVRLRPGPGIEVRVAGAISMPRWGESFGRLLGGRRDGVSGMQAFVAGTGGSPPVTAPDVGRLRDLAGRVAAAAAAPRREGATPAVATGDFRVLSVAAVADLDADPFGLPDGGSTRFHVEASAHQPSGRSPTSVRLQASGLLVRLPGPPGGPVTVAATGVYGMTENDVGSGGTFENRTLVLTRTEGEEPTTTATDPASGLSVELRLGGDPLRAELVVRTPAGDGEERTAIAALTATRDPSVLRPGNVHHDGAASALVMLSAAHPDDPLYAERAYQELFPAGDAGVATVQAHRDWVLFRRRGRHDREGISVIPAPADTVAVRVLQVPDAEAAAAVASSVRSGAATSWPGEWTTAEVAFAGGTTTLLTPAPVWAQRYRAAGGADVVALAGYAPAGGSLGTLVGHGRLTALLSALSPPVSSEPGAPVVPVSPPDSLRPPPGADGSAFLLTHPVEPDPKPVLAVRGLMTDGNADVIARIEQLDVTLATDSAPFAALGEGGPETLDVDRAIAELTTFMGDLDAWLAAVETVLWTDESLSGEVAAALAEAAARVEAAAREIPRVVVTEGRRSAVDLGPSGDSPSAQLFLLVTMNPGIG